MFYGRTGILKLRVTTAHEGGGAAAGRATLVETKGLLEEESGSCTHE